MFYSTRKMKGWIDEIEKLEKDKEITEDDKFWGYEKLQEITDGNTKKIDDLGAAKEKEILEL